MFRTLLSGLCSRSVVFMTSFAEPCLPRFAYKALFTKLCFQNCDFRALGALFTKLGLQSFVHRALFTALCLRSFVYRALLTEICLHSCVSRALFTELCLQSFVCLEWPPCLYLCRFVYLVLLT